MVGLNTKVPDETGKASPDSVTEVGQYYTEPAYRSSDGTVRNKKCVISLTLSYFDQDDRST